MKWSKTFPKKQGNYWFYGYRYGKVSCGSKEEPSYMFVKARKTGSGVMCIAEGQFMYESETEEAHFLPASMPKPPEINTELTPEQAETVRKKEELYNRIGLDKS